MTHAVETLIAHQERLIAALDADDVAGIAAHSAAIGAALAAVREGGDASPATRALAARSLALADDARVRLNVLADMTQRRLARLAAATGKGAATQTYGRDARLRTA